MLRISKHIDGPRARLELEGKLDTVVAEIERRFRLVDDSYEIVVEQRASEPARRGWSLFGGRKNGR